jgi:hypothetical protein
MNPTFTQFYGAVKTRIEDRQKAFWSRIIGAGFIADDIENIWPESNMRFFSMRYAGNTQSFQLRDLNLRELDAIKEWLERQCTHRNATVTEDGGRCDLCNADLNYDPASRNWTGNSEPVIKADKLAALKAGALR